MLRHAGMFVGAIIILQTAAGTTAEAQRREGARTLTLAEVGDMQTALRDLDAKVRADGKDFVSLYQRGLLAWDLATRARAANPPRDLDATRLNRVADESLRLAAELAPDSADYARMTGLFLLESGNPSARSAATGYFDNAAEAARKTGSVQSRALAFLEAGQAHWRRYDNYANRRVETSMGATIRSYSEGANAGLKGTSDATVVPTGLMSMKAVINNWLNGTRPVAGDVNADGDYQQANELFREAYAADPANARIVRSVAMMLAEKNRWAELESFTRAHLVKFPNDAGAQMALGLALHRTARSAAAEIAFDAALRSMSPSERGRLDRFQRIRPPTADTSAVARGTQAERDAMQHLYWMLSKPLWSDAANGPRVEYLSRVTYAELRWTVDESNVKGADTDRGNVFIRYGPPKTIGVMHPAMRDPVDTPNGNELTTVWIYDTGLMFVFKGALSFATAETAPDDRRIVTEIVNINPVRWDNIVVPTVDSMPTQIARFRAGRDSVDVVLAAVPNIEAIQPPVTGAPPVNARVWWAGFGGNIFYKDSVALKASRPLGWTHRFARGGYVIRAEATSDQAQRAARTTLIVDAGSAPASFASSGFGISDLLLAGTALSTGRAGERWNELSVTPIAEAIKANSSISLVWENYEFGAKDGSAQFDVVITLTRNRTVGGRIGATVIGALANVAQVDHRSDRVTITLNRSLPNAPAFADQVSVSLKDTPPGEYQISLQVTDRVTRQTATRLRRFVIE